MKIKLGGTWAGPKGVIPAGSIIEVSDEMGHQLVDSRQAVLIEDSKAKAIDPEVAKPIETAEVRTLETAEAYKSRRGRPKNAEVSES